MKLSFAFAGLVAGPLVGAPGVGAGSVALVMNENAPTSLAVQGPKFCGPCAVNRTASDFILTDDDSNARLPPA